MKNKYTAGPWEISAHEDNGEIVIRSPLTLNIVCNCEADGFGEVGEKETSANAALIAAAPDLLAALEFCADALNTEAGGLYKAHIEQARAAIAKAKGVIQ